MKRHRSLRSPLRRTRRSPGSPPEEHDAPVTRRSERKENNRSPGSPDKSAGRGRPTRSASPSPTQSKSERRLLRSASTSSSPQPEPGRKTPDRRHSSVSDTLRRKALTSSAKKMVKSKLHDSGITPRTQITEFVASMATAEPVVRGKRRVSPNAKNTAKKLKTARQDKETPRTMIERHITEANTITPVIRPKRRVRSEQLEPEPLLNQHTSITSKRKSHSSYHDDDAEHTDDVTPDIIVPSSQPSVARLKMNEKNKQKITDAIAKSFIQEQESTMIGSQPGGIRRKPGLQKIAHFLDQISQDVSTTSSSLSSSLGIPESPSTTIGSLSPFSDSNLNSPMSGKNLYRKIKSVRTAVVHDTTERRHSRRSLAEDSSIKDQEASNISKINSEKRRSHRSLLGDPNIGDQVESQASVRSSKSVDKKLTQFGQVKETPSRRTNTLRFTVVNDANKEISPTKVDDADHIVIDGLDTEEFPEEEEETPEVFPAEMELEDQDKDENDIEENVEDDEVIKDYDVLQNKSNAENDVDIREYDISSMYAGSVNEDAGVSGIELISTSDIEESIVNSHFNLVVREDAMSPVIPMQTTESFQRQARSTDHSQVADDSITASLQRRARSVDHSPAAGNSFIGSAQVAGDSTVGSTGRSPAADNSITASLQRQARSADRSQVAGNSTIVSAGRSPAVGNSITASLQRPTRSIGRPSASSGISISVPTARVPGFHSPIVDQSLIWKNASSLTELDSDMKKQASTLSPTSNQSTAEGLSVSSKERRKSAQTSPLPGSTGNLSKTSNLTFGGGDKSFEMLSSKFTFGGGDKSFEMLSSKLTFGGGDKILEKPSRNRVSTSATPRMIQDNYSDPIVSTSQRSESDHEFAVPNLSARSSGGTKSRRFISPSPRVRTPASGRSTTSSPSPILAPELPKSAFRATPPASLSSPEALNQAEITRTHVSPVVLQPLVEERYGSPEPSTSKSIVKENKSKNTSLRKHKIGDRESNLFDFFNTLEEHNTTTGGARVLTPKANPKLLKRAKTAAKAPTTRKESSTIKKKPKKREIGVNVSSMKSMFNHFARFPVARTAYGDIEKICEQFWASAADDLEVYAEHAHREYVNASDVELLMKRQRFITDKQSVFSLAEKFLPLEYRAKVIPMARSGNKVTGTLLKSAKNRI